MAPGWMAGRESQGFLHQGQSLVQAGCDFRALRLGSPGKEWMKGSLAIPASVTALTFALELEEHLVVFALKCQMPRSSSTMEGKTDPERRLTQDHSRPWGYLWLSSACSALFCAPCNSGSIGTVLKRHPLHIEIEEAKSTKPHARSQPAPFSPCGLEQRLAVATRKTRVLASSPVSGVTTGTRIVLTLSPANSEAQAW